jgi:hypothetical protein
LITVCPPELRFVGTVTTPPQRPDVSLGLALLQEAHPVLAGVIDEHPAFDPKAWTLPRRSAGPRRPRRPRAGTLRELGLSRQKANTVLDLAKRFVDGRLSEAALRKLPDQIG